MPIGLSPNNTVKVCLDSDIADYPEDSRPTFIIGFPTANQHVLISDTFDKLVAAKNPREQVDQLTALVKLLVRDTMNACAVDEIPDTLTFREMNELANKALEATRLSENDRKKSGSSLNSDSADSAASAEPKAAA